MTTIDRRAAHNDPAMSARIVAMALEQDARACIGGHATALHAAAARKRAEADQIDQHRVGVAA